MILVKKKRITTLYMTQSYRVITCWSCGSNGPISNTIKCTRHKNKQTKLRIEVHVACIVSVSTRVCRESWDESKKKRNEETLATQAKVHVRSLLTVANFFEASDNRCCTGRAKSESLSFKEQEDTSSQILLFIQTFWVRSSHY